MVTAPAKHSVAESLASLPESERQELLASLSEEDAAALLWDWSFWARPEQLPPPGDWDTWLILTGRGWGKTRTGAEWVRDGVTSGKFSRIALVGATAADVRDVMVEGPAGILACSPPDNYPTYEPSKRRVTWPNGAVAITYSADEPNRLRGPAHDAAWADELAAWRFPDAWDQLMFGLRMGERPQVVVTTTPRPIPLIRELAASPTTHVTRGSTWENVANLAPAAVTKLREKYAGTRLGRQELDGEILDDTPGALWHLKQIDALRVTAHPELRRIVVAIDPAVTSNADSDETGIVVAGLGARDGHGYVLEDCTQTQESPDTWMRAAVDAYYRWQADRIVAEVNNGGDLVESLLRTVDPNVPFTAVRASRGKQTRAEPVAALYEQKRVHHVGAFSALEDQMTTWAPAIATKSPDRMDALVWALTALMLESPGPQRRVVHLAERRRL